MEIKNKIVESIQTINPFDDTEKEHLDDAVKWIKSGVEIFRIEKPATPSKHLVCYAVLCDIDKQKILLFEHKKAELLLPGGGHVDKNEMLHMHRFVKKLTSFLEIAR